VLGAVSTVPNTACDKRHRLTYDANVDGRSDALNHLIMEVETHFAGDNDNLRLRKHWSWIKGILPEPPNEWFAELALFSVKERLAQSTHPTGKTHMFKTTER
jgi:hypothetical protein